MFRRSTSRKSAHIIFSVIDSETYLPPGQVEVGLKEKPELFEVLVNPFALSNGFAGPEQAQDSKPIYDDKLETWVAPFFMAPINTKNVHRSNQMLNHPYGEDFLYDEMFSAGPGEEGEKKAQAIAMYNPMLGDNVPKPGEGPSKESRDSGSLHDCREFWKSVHACSAKSVAAELSR